MIEAKDVSCTFARNPFSKEGFMAVSPVSIQFIDGERYAIVGESGSGKTTLARMIAGLQRPTTGNIYVDGMPVYGKHKVHTNYFKVCFLFPCSYCSFFSLVESMIHSPTVSCY